MWALTSLVVAVVLILREDGVSAWYPRGGDCGDCRSLGPGGGLRCRVTDQMGTPVEEKTCPLSMPCTVGGRLEYFNGSLALISYFCEVPIPSKPHICRITDSSNNVLMENPCPTGNTCTGGPKNSTFYGNAISVYECVNPAEALPKLCSVDDNVCPTPSFWDWRSWGCRPTKKYYFCDQYPEENTTPSPETKYVCDVWGARTSASYSSCPAGQTCSAGIPARLQDGTIVKALVCMLDSPREKYPSFYHGYRRGYH